MAKVKIHGLGVVILGMVAQVALANPITPVDAFINLGTSPYPEESTIPTGNAQPWYDSSQIARFFGGQSTTAQQASFDTTILQRVQQAFSQSGVPITLTDDPSVAVRRAVLLAQRRRGSPDLARFLDDPDASLVVEAARAIHDVPIEPALPKLAALIQRRGLSEPLGYRVLNANFRVGKAENASAVARSESTRGKVSSRVPLPT